MKIKLFLISHSTDMASNTPLMKS